MAYRMCYDNKCHWLRLFNNNARQNEILFANKTLTLYKNMQSRTRVGFFGSTQAEDGIGLASKLHLEAIENSHQEKYLINKNILSRPVTLENNTSGSQLLTGIDDKLIMENEINYFHFSPRWCNYYFKDNSLHERLLLKKNIGYWVCEVSEIPEKWLSHKKVYSEIWTSSDFCRDIYQKRLDIPVVTVPHPIAYRELSTHIQNWVEEEENRPFRYLTIANAYSDLARKNITGVVKAYKMAYPKENKLKQQLIIKLTNIESDPIGFEEIKRAAVGRVDIDIISEHYSPNQISDLYDTCNAYISLHRSEGFGLTISDALGRGIPSIVTNYSGNVDFCKEGTGAYMVRYSLVKVGSDRLRYNSESIWAEPDLEDAAKGLLEVRDSYPSYIQRAKEHR